MMKGGDNDDEKEGEEKKENEGKEDNEIERS